MRKSSATVVILCISLLFYVAVAAQERITSAEAIKYIGRVVTVCGQLASSNFEFRKRGQPTFLNLDQPDPNAIFTAVIWGENRVRFRTAPEQMYTGKNICISGRILSYRGEPQIVVTNPSQIFVNTGY